MKKLAVGVALAAVIAGGAYQFIFKAPEVVKVEIQESKYQQYSNPNIVITPAQAKDLIASKQDVVIIDVRRITDYLGKGHIENAHQVWRPAIQANSGEYEFGGMRASREKMEELLSSLGVTPDTTIIPYDAKGNYDAARLWWILDMYGHKNVKVIDGGVQGWMAAEFEMVRSESEHRKPTEYRFRQAVDTSRLASLADIKAAMADPNVIILDTRSLAEHTGDKQAGSAERAGRIPGSVFLEYKNALDEGKNFKSLAELKAIYEAAGVTADRPIIAYCQSAVRSAHTTFVLTQLMGYKNVKNYDGSWLEWAHSEEPLETGEPLIKATAIASVN